MPNMMDVSLTMSALNLCTAALVWDRGGDIEELKLAAEAYSLALRLAVEEDEWIDEAYSSEGINGSE